jgi:hypothetical protein
MLRMYIGQPIARGEHQAGPSSCFVDVGRNKRLSGCTNGALNRIREEWPTTRPQTLGAATLLRAARCQALLLDPKCMTTFPRGMSFLQVPKSLRGRGLAQLEQYSKDVRRTFHQAPVDRIDGGRVNFN